MTPALETHRLETAFADRTDLQEAIKKAANTPKLVDLFNDISLYVSELFQNSSASSRHVAKKRRFNDSNISEIHTPDDYQNGSTNGASNAAEEEDDENALLAVQDISVVIPQRKKYTIEFTKTRIRARDPKTKELVSGVGCKWADIEHAFLLPVPEKSQKQFNYILFPTRSFLPSSRTAPQTDAPEPLIFTIPSTAPKPASLSGKDLSAASAVADDYKSLFDWALNRHLKTSKKQVKIIEANERQFHSVLRQPQRPGEKAVHVKGFRGSKDGFLFFLETGILWGFKKPVLFLPIDRIASVAYTSVLQRTFNLSVEVYVEGDEEKEELEFSMLDQEDFAGIDGFVRRYGLQDGSMAEARKAKREGVNVVRNEKGEVVGVEESGHLARAAVEGGIGDGEEMEGLEGNGGFDEEDEEEEDYDPGSEGESEGSGSSSEDEDEDGGGGGGGDEDDDEGSVASDDMLEA